MRINPIISTTNNTHFVKTNNKQGLSITKPLEKDSVSFKGAVYNNRQLDQYLEHMRQHRELTKEFARKITSTKKTLETKMSKINEKIEPLLQDKSFLLAIAPEKQKNECSREANKMLTQIGDYDKKTYDKVWGNVTSKIIKTRILNEDPNVIAVELVEASPRIQKEEHKPIFEELKTRILEKASEKKNYVDIVQRAQVEHEAKTCEIEDMAEFFYGPQDGEDRKVFVKELVNRAKAKDPSLGDFYVSAYNTYFHEYKTSANDFHTLKKESADYAYLETFKFIRGDHEELINV